MLAGIRYCGGVDSEAVSGVLYLDANATTPIAPAVLEAMMPWLRDGYANPSGAHSAAKRAREAIERARAQVAGLIGAEPEEIVFTGCGTESLNAALFSMHQLCGPGHALVSSIEHSAVLRAVAAMDREVVEIPCLPDGRVDLEAASRLMKGAAFVSVMTANNETGVIQPISEISALARKAGLPLHTDAVQAVGKIPMDVRNPGVEMLSLAAHKFYGPKGVGALFVRRGLRFLPFLRGGSQESGRRSGTENTAGIVGVGAAAELAGQSFADSSVRDWFEGKIIELLDGVTLNGAAAPRLPNTSHLSIHGCDAAGMLILLDEAGVACSAGSACMTGKSKPSHVQLAMGIDEARARTSLRISFLRNATIGNAGVAAEKIAAAANKLRRVQGHGVGPVVVYSPGD
jgi:cysteine desulfurase